MSLLIAYLALGGPTASADKSHVYDGMTATELKAFAERQGWKAESAPSGASVTIEAEGQHVDITLLGCGDSGVCRSAIIRRTTYYSIKPSCTLWHWNLETRGATGYGPDYVTLQRYLQLRGITDQYLRDVFQDWLSAAPDFWKLVESCYAEENSPPARKP